MRRFRKPWSTPRWLSRSRVKVKPRKAPRSCLICAKFPPHGKDSICPQAAVTRLEGRDCSSCLGAGRRYSKGGRYREGRKKVPNFSCGECTELLRKIGHWKKVRDAVRRRARRGGKWVGGEVLERMAVIGEKCPQCGQKEWMPKVDLHGAVAWECRAKVKCPRCQGAKYMGDTPEERAAQIIGGFGKCGNCHGEGMIRCHLVLELPLS